MRKITFFIMLTFFAILLASCHAVAPTSNEENSKEDRLTEVSFEKTLPYLRVHYIYAGQADATLLQLVDEDESFNILIDTGDWNASDVVSYLESENINDIDLIAVTHPHADHIGQLAKIINKFHVDEVWMNGDTAASQAIDNALKAIEENDIGYYEPTAGETFDIGELQIDVIHPSDLTLNTNNNSIVMRIQYGEIVFLFTGDAQHKAEEKMLASGADLSAHILHIGHHGSKTSTSTEFLEAVNPETAIYSAGVDNSYGLPDRGVIERINMQDARVYGTDIYGTIIIETDGTKYHIMTEKQGTLPTPVQGKACVNINSASAEELQQIIHIGDKLAENLIDLRPYESINDLQKIKGIGASRLEDIKQQKVACLGG